MKILSETQFFNKLNHQLPYKPDSANYHIYQIIHDILLSDGGDDDFALLNTNDIAIQFSKQITLQDIEHYDNTEDTYEAVLSIYLKHKPTILKLNS